jgi:hypothetical protein
MVSLLIHSVTALSQSDLLMLQKRNKNKNVYYKAGEVISFGIKGRKSRITAEILGFEDSVIVFKGFKVPVNDITYLYIDEKTRWWLRYKIAQILLIGGAGYLALDVINTGEFNKETLMISAAAIGAGLTAKLLIRNRLRIRGRTNLRILKLSAT